MLIIKIKLKLILLYHICMYVCIYVYIYEENSILFFLDLPNKKFYLCYWFAVITLPIS